MPPTSKRLYQLKLHLPPEKTIGLRVVDSEKWPSSILTETLNDSIFSSFLNFPKLHQDFFHPQAPSSVARLFLSWLRFDISSSSSYSRRESTQHTCLRFNHPPLRAPRVFRQRPKNARAKTSSKNVVQRRLGSTTAIITRARVSDSPRIIVENDRDEDENFG